MGPAHTKVLWEALGQYVQNQQDHVDSLDDGVERTEAEAKLALAEELLGELDAQFAALAEAA